MNELIQTAIEQIENSDNKRKPELYIISMSEFTRIAKIEKRSKENDRQEKSEPIKSK